MAGTPLVQIQHRIDLSQLEDPAKRAENLVPVWQRGIQPIVTAFLAARFDTEGAHMTGKRWPRLAPVTLALRKQPGRGRGGIGRDTNRMWGSLLKSAGATAAPEGILVMTKDRYERGTAVTNKGFPYALAFDRGYNSKTVPVPTVKNGRAGWTFIRRKTPKRIPGRPIFPDPLPPQLTAQFDMVVKRYLGTGEV